MSDENAFDGFMPSLQNVEISGATSMITTDGDLLEGHTVQLSLGDDSKVVFSCTEQQLQGIFFLIMKTLS